MEKILSDEFFITIFLSETQPFRVISKFDAKNMNDKIVSNFVGEENG